MCVCVCVPTLTCICMCTNTRLHLCIQPHRSQRKCVVLPQKRRARYPGLTIKNFIVT